MKNFTKIILPFVVALVGFFSFGSIVLADYYATTTATTSGSFVVPLGVTSLNVSLTAAGGGGAGGAFTYGGGGGGAGSSVSNLNIAVCIALSSLIFIIIKDKFNSFWALFIYNQYGDFPTALL